MRILNLEKIEIFLPVRPFLIEWFVAIADLDPLHAVIIELSSFRHISKIFAACNGSTAKRSIENGTGKCLRSSGFYFRSNEVTHFKSLAESRRLRGLHGFYLRNPRNLRLVFKTRTSTRTASLAHLQTM